MRSTHAGARTRRIGAPWLVAAIAALLAACGSGTPDKSDNGSSNGGGGGPWKPAARSNTRTERVYPASR
jgi:hypothetical protein